MNETEIADLIAKEARQQSLNASKLGPIAYLMKARSTGTERPSGINKTFLANTVRSVEAHNRREEIEDCWRQHKLLERKRPIDQCSDSHYPRNRRELTENAYEDERGRWSLKKLKAFASFPDNSIQEEVIDSSSSSSDSSNHKEKKKQKRKKQKKSKKSKSEKKEKKKKKSKKRKSDEDEI